MPTANKNYKYSVELNITTVNALNFGLTNKGDLYINICLLGTHQRTSRMPPVLPMHINQSFHFNKVFKSCYEPQDIIQRLEREHVLIELLQTNGIASTVLAKYETSAKDFLYPNSLKRIQYVGLQKHILLNRTIDFSGINPSLEYSVSPSIDDTTGMKKRTKNHEYRRPIVSYGTSPKQAHSLVWKPSSTYPKPIPLNDPTILSTSVTSHTISSAVKNDFSQPDTQAKLQELAVPGEVKYVVPIDKTRGREPFVVRHVTNDLIGRKPLSHDVFNDGLLVNDYSFSRGNSSASLYSLNDDDYHSRSISRGNRRRSTSRGLRARSASASRRFPRLSQSADFEVRGRSQTPERYSDLHLTTARRYNDYDYHSSKDEFHSTNDCAICRLHRMHREQSQRAKSLDPKQFVTLSEDNSYSPAAYSHSTSPYLTTSTLSRDPFRYRYRQSPAGELSDKVLHTLRRNLESYSAQPPHKYYSAFRYSDGHANDADPFE